MNRAWSTLTQKPSARILRGSSTRRHHLGEHLPGPGIVRRQQVRQPLDVVAPTAPPWNLPQIETVVDAVVGERRQALLVDGVPQPKLGGDSIVEPVQQRETVAALRRRGEPQQLDRA